MYLKLGVLVAIWGPASRAPLAEALLPVSGVELQIVLLATQTLKRRHP